jgi:hypothetical protein
MFQIGTQKFWLRVAHSFGGFLTRKKLAKLLDQYFGPNDTCEEVAVRTVCKLQCLRLDNKACILYN